MKPFYDLISNIGAASADALAPLAQTRRELADRFTGVTAYVRSPAKGLWTAPDGQIEQDDVVMVEVVTDTCIVSARHQGTEDGTLFRRLYKAFELVRRSSAERATRADCLDIAARSLQGAPYVDRRVGTRGPARSAAGL
jgi:hypothetical protein